MLGVFVAITIAIVIHGCQGIHVQTPTQTIDVATPYFKYFGKQPPFNITARIVPAQPVLACTPIENRAAVSGKVVYVLGFGCSLEHKTRMAQQAGAVAVFIDSYFYGPISDPSLINNRDADGTDKIVAISNIDYPDFPKLFFTNQTVIVHIEPEESQFYRPDVWIPLSVILGIFALFCAGLATKRLYTFVLRRGLEASLPQICLFVEIISNLERLALAFEFWPWNGIYPAVYRAILMNLHMTVFTTLLITVYWYRIFAHQTGIHVMTGLSKWKWPFVVWSITLFCVVVIMSALDALRINTIIVKVYMPFFAATQIAIAIFWFVTARKVLSYLKASDSYQDMVVKDVTILILINGCAIVVHAVNILVNMLVISLYHNVYTVATSFFILLMAVTTSSFIQIVIFKSPNSLHDSLVMDDVSTSGPSTQSVST